MSFTFCLLYAFIGIAAGAMSSALGVGASVLFLPALIWTLPQIGIDHNLVPATAVATSLAASCSVVCSSSWAHWRAGNLSWVNSSVLTLLIAAAVGGLAGGQVLHIAPGSIILGMAAIAQVIVATLLFKRAAAGRASGTAPASAEPSGERVNASGWPNVTYVGAVGLLTSVGAGGTYLVPYFLWRGFNRVQAIGLASVLGVAIAPAATLTCLMQGNALSEGLIQGRVAMVLGAGALLGAHVGTHLLARASSGTWSRLLACALLTSSFRTIGKIV